MIVFQFFQRELLVNRVSKLISNLGGDGFTDSKKINLIVTTHTIQHAQDAFALINMGLILFIILIFKRIRMIMIYLC